MPDPPIDFSRYAPSRHRPSYRWRCACPTARRRFFHWSRYRLLVFLCDHCLAYVKGHMPSRYDPLPVFPIIPPKPPNTPAHTIATLRTCPPERLRGRRK